jgi:RNA polymerase sigma-70 factor (ECF subfamily)
MGAEQVEREIASMLERGDLAGAASATLAAYGPGIVGYLDALLRDGGDAAEVYAIFNLDLWRSLRGFRRACAMKTWAYKLARNAAMRFLKRPERRRVRRLRTSEAANLAAAARSTTSSAQREARRDGLRQLRAGLEPDEQTLLVLRLDRGMAWKEIAEILAADGEALDEAALRKRFERLKIRLRALARASGGARP